MNILFIGALPEPVTGQSLACQVLLDDLSTRHTVDVVNMSKPEFKQGISSFARVFAVLSIIWSAARKAHRADVIYLTISQSFAGSLKDVAIYLACFPQLRRMVIHLHGGAGFRGIVLGHRRIQRRVNEFFLRQLGGAIVLGPRHADLFANSLPPNRIHIVPNFAQAHLFVSDAEIDAKFARTSPLRLLFVSNLLPGKGYEELVSAIESLDDRARAGIVVDFAGGFESGAHRAAFLRRIRPLAEVRYHGVVGGKRKQDLFRRAHVFCLPTYYPYEGQPISILEAYASGCAVITTDHSGIRDVFTPNVSGIEVAKRSSGAVRAAIEAALSDPARMGVMARHNAKVAKTCYRTEEYNRRLENVLIGRSDCSVSRLARCPQESLGVAPEAKAHPQVG